MGITQPPLVPGECREICGVPFHPRSLGLPVPPWLGGPTEDLVTGLGAIAPACALSPVLWVGYLRRELVATFGGAYALSPLAGARGWLRPLRRVSALGWPLFSHRKEKRTSSDGRDVHSGEATSKIRG